jgi:hypothetical protein
MEVYRAVEKNCSIMTAIDWFQIKRYNVVAFYVNLNYVNLKWYDIKSINTNLTLCSKFEIMQIKK